MSSHQANRHRSARRHPRQRRRPSIFGRILVVTVLVGSVAVGVLPQVRQAQTQTSTATSGSGSAVSGASALEQASLAALSRPVSQAIAEQDAEAEDLKLKITKAAKVKSSDALPDGSGDGRRIVFSESAQRVWLVAEGDAVERTYLVSGSKFDNLNLGTYAVQSRARTATAFDYSGSMEYFVRFATGFTAPIGFHTVPVDKAGRPEQTKEQLGIPLSAGCVRQWRDDAVALWTFAPIGTKVVVTA